MSISYAISALPAFSAYAGGDLFAIVDISDFTEAPTGTTKKITVTDLFTNVSLTGPATFANNIVMTAASSKIIPGATAFSIRNHADSASNVLVSDAGTMSIVGALQVLNSANKYLSGSATDLVVGNDDTGGMVKLRTEGSTRVTVASALTTVANAMSLSSTLSVAGLALFNTTAQFAGGSNSVTFGSQTIGSGLTWGTDNGFDIGAAGANRPRTGYFGTSVIAPLFTGNLTGVLTVATGTAVAGTIFKTAANGLVIQGAAGSSNDLIITTSVNSLVANVPTGTANIGFAADVTASGILTGLKLRGGGSAPSAVVGTGAGTGPSAVTVTGTNTAGTLGVTTGTATNTGTFITVTYNGTAYLTAPYVVASYSSNLSGSYPAIVVNTRSTTGFSLSLSPAPTTNSVYELTFHVIQ